MIQCSPDDISCTVAPDGKSITFEPCGRVSFHPVDVASRYCAGCHRFMALLEIARDIRKDFGMWPDPS